MKKLIVGLSAVLIAVAAWAVPTQRQVEDEVQRGNYAGAETMMAEVVAARPTSAKAHYLYSEILAHQRNFAKAADEARAARTIDPQITFTQPEKFRSFEQLLDRELHPVAAPRATEPRRQAAAPVAPPSTQASGLQIPGWAWGLGLAAIAFVAWRGFNRSRAAGAAAGMGGMGAAPMGASAGPVAGGPAGYPPGAGYPQQQGANYGMAPNQGMPGRSGMLGTGLAVAGGVAAGMFADRLLNPHNGGATGDTSHLAPTGLDPTALDDPGADLAARPVDFGNGGDWGNDVGSADAGSFDTGSSDDGGWG